jgi:phosphatidate cytidylyltransferase
MTKEFNLRIYTSVSLIILLILMLKFSVVLISALLLIFVISWLEFNNILENIYNKNRKLILKNFLKFCIFIYLLFFMKVVIDEFLQNQPNISWNLIFIISICILSDVGGYIFGKSFKGKKLTKISPNKTYSGMVGSFTLSIIFCIIYSYSISFVNFQTIILLTIIISFICQIGDLFISFLKRKAKLKDTGNILPGHGGILDRIDGTLFALPSGIILINYFY